MRRREARLICVVVVAAFLLLQASPARSAREVRRVLIINDLGIISSPGFAEIVQAIFAGLQKSPYRIELYEESLDLSLFPDRVSQDNFRQEIIQKYSARKPDVIIAAGPVSLKFIAEAYDKFQGTPTIFCTIWSGIPGEVRHGMPFTGVLAQLDAEGTLKAALHLLPNTKHVVVVGGVGKFDEGFEAIAKQSFHNDESKLEFTYLFDLTMPALLERLRHLPKDTIVYHTAISQDAAGDRFIDSAQSIPMVASAANAPVFVMDDVDLRAGTVGGDLVNWTDNGRIAAEMAVRVLNGEKPQDIPIARSTNAYMFDWRALKHWGLKEKNLPPGSIVLNRQLTVWESYKWYIISGIALILLEALLIGGLLWQRARRRKAEANLALTYDRFRLAVEAGKSVGWDWDVQSGRTQWFGDLQTMLGIPADSYSGHVEDFRRSIHPEDRELVWKAVDDARQSRSPYVAEFRVIRADGTVRWITASGKFLFAPNGDPRRMLGMALDITEREQMEGRLREYEKVVEVLGDRIMVVDREYRYVIANAAFLTYRGFAKEQVIGHTVAEIVGKETFEADIKERFDECFQGKVVRYEVKYSYPKLGERNISAAYFPIRGPLGIDRIACILQDITERKRAEEALQQRETELKEAQRLAGLGSWQWDPRTDAVIWSKELYHLMGIDPTLSAPSYEEHAHLFAAESWERLQRAIQGALQSGTSYELDLEIVRPESIAKWEIARGEPVRDKSGQIIGLRGTIQDITERKLAEETVRESEERFRLVANNAPVMIWMSGPDKKPTYFNQLWLDFTGLSETDLINNLAGIVHPDDYLQCHGVYCRGFDQRQPFKKECRLRRHDGEYRYILDVGVPRLNNDGSFAGYIGSCIDVTDRKLAEDALTSMSRKLVQAQEQERARIARELHDDINQRLAMLGIDLQQLQEHHPELPVEIGSRMKELQEQAMGMANDVQALSHELHSSKLEYLGAIGGMKSWCKEFGQRQGLQIEFKGPESKTSVPPEVGLSLFRVLQEALHNAAKHSGVRRIEVQLQEDSGEIHLIVSDLGKGFDTETATQGRGLGLASMQERLRLVGGELSIESQPQHGTMIHARVPLGSVGDSMRAAG